MRIEVHKYFCTRKRGVKRINLTGEQDACFLFFFLCVRVGAETWHGCAHVDRLFYVFSRVNGLYAGWSSYSCTQKQEMVKTAKYMKFGT